MVITIDIIDTYGSTVPMLLRMTIQSQNAPLRLRDKIHFSAGEGGENST